MSLGTESADSAPQNYAGKPHSAKVSIPIAHGMLLWAPWANSPRPDVPKYPGRNARLLELFRHRVSLSTIQAWRYGHKNPPQWACDILANHLRKSAYEQLQAADMLTKEKGR